MNKIKSYDEFRGRLAFYAEDEYRKFAMKGIPCERPFIGVRIPTVRSVVNLVPRELYEDFLNVEPVAIEEVLARGMLICKLPYTDMLKWFDSQISYIDNWCTCDVFCSGVCKVTRKYKKDFFDSKVGKLLKNDSEYAVRVGLVIMKCGYVDEEWLAVIFDRVEKLCIRDEYYIKMAIAWLIAECFIKFPTATTGYLVVSHLPKWTFNKTISKICDSYRVDEETKKLLKRMRK